MENFERFVREKQLDEKFTNKEYVIDQLSNSMEHYDETSFAMHMKRETGIDQSVFRAIYKEWKKLSGHVKNQNAYGWDKWLDQFSRLLPFGWGGADGLKERYNSPSYKGRVSTVRGGVAMTDDSLDRMRIMMRNISKFEGVDVLADEISNALSNLEIRELKGLL